MAKRDYYFDNGKFLLIFFVVFGHFIRSLIDESIFIRALYNTIYTFHMPAFILISGYFASPELNKKKLVKLIKRLLIPYFIFQTIYIFFYYFLINDALDFDYFLSRMVAMVPAQPVFLGIFYYRYSPVLNRLSACCWRSFVESVSVISIYPVLFSVYPGPLYSFPFSC